MGGVAVDLGDAEGGEDGGVEGLADGHGLDAEGEVAEKGVAVGVGFVVCHCEDLGRSGCGVMGLMLWLWGDRLEVIDGISAVAVPRYGGRGTRLRG